MRRSAILVSGTMLALCPMAMSGGVGCPDTDGDEMIDSADLNAVLGLFGESGAGLSGDVNGAWPSIRPT